MNITQYDIKLRPAKVDDATMMLEWRNDPETRKQSANQEEIAYEDHIKWLHKVLDDANRHLYIAETYEGPVGMVRADYEEGVYELSWTVAPDQRGKGAGAAIVQKIIEKLDAPVFARVKTDNHASRKIAENVGLTLAEKKDNFLHYKQLGSSYGKNDI